MSFSATALKSYVQTLERNGYFYLEACRKGTGQFRYGPFGIHLKENIFHEWKRNVMNSHEIHVFPVSAFQHNQYSNTSMPDLTEHYDNYNTLKTRNNHFTLPFGMASWKIARVVGQDLKESSEDLFKDIWSLQESTLLTSTYFSTCKESVYWFDRLHRQRLRWWKYLSQMPSSFTVTDTPSNDYTTGQVNIQFNYKGKILPVESISNFGSMRMESEMPHIIVSECNLDKAVLAYLLDAHQESPQGRQVLSLNSSVVPYKVSLAFRNKPESNDAYHLVQYIVTELCKAELTVFPNPHLQSQLDITEQLLWFDELGISYVIILEKSTLSNGIVHLRNRDTTLEEQMHLADVKNMLSKYCKI